VRRSLNEKILHYSIASHAHALTLAKLAAAETEVKKKEKIADFRARKKTGKLLFPAYRFFKTFLSFSSNSLSPVREREEVKNPAEELYQAIIKLVNKIDEDYEVQLEAARVKNEALYNMAENIAVEPKTNSSLSFESSWWGIDFTWKW
jgi:hypothetical protein